MRYTFNYFYKSTGMDVADERQYTIEGDNAKDALAKLLSQSEIKPQAQWFLSCLSITLSAKEIMKNQNNYKERVDMITKSEFEQGKSEQAKIEIKSVIESIEAALRNGSTAVSTYKSFKTPDNIIVAAVTKHVAEYGWSLKHSSYAGDQRDPGTTHTWTLT